MYVAVRVLERQIWGFLSDFLIFGVWIFADSGYLDFGRVFQQPFEKCLPNSFNSDCRNLLKGVSKKGFQ